MTFQQNPLALGIDGMPREIQASDDFIDLNGCIRHAVSVSGKSGKQVSREIGRSDNYLWSMLRNKTMPGVDLLVSILQACGYSVTIDGHGETISLYIDDAGNLAANLDNVVEGDSPELTEAVHAAIDALLASGPTN